MSTGRAIGAAIGLALFILFFATIAGRLTNPVSAAELDADGRAGALTAVRYDEAWITSPRSNSKPSNSRSAGISVPPRARVNEQITTLSPANQGAWTRLARCCLELGQLDDATAALDRALQLNPQNTIARNLHIEVSKRRAGPIAAVAPRKRASAAPRASAGAATATGAACRRGPAPTSLTLGGFGRAEFAALGHLPPQPPWNR